MKLFVGNVPVAIAVTAPLCVMTATQSTAASPVETAVVTARAVATGGRIPCGTVTTEPVKPVAVGLNWKDSETTFPHRKALRFVTPEIVVKELLTSSKLASTKLSNYRLLCDNASEILSRNTQIIVLRQNCYFRFSRQPQHMLCLI